MERETECFHFYHTCLHFSTWLLSLAESWPVKKVSQRATVHGSSQQQERWDRDESLRCPFLQLSAGISPRLIPLLVWLQQGHDLQRSQILQVSPAINQSNMSRVLSPWPSPQRFTDSYCRDPSLCIYLPSHVGAVKWCVNYDPHPVITLRKYRPEKYPFKLYNFTASLQYYFLSFYASYVSMNWLVLQLLESIFSAYCSTI